jgi:hypothetical protein
VDQETKGLSYSFDKFFLTKKNPSVKFSIGLEARKSYTVSTRYLDRGQKVYPPEMENTREDRAYSPGSSGRNARKTSPESVM